MEIFTFYTIQNNTAVRARQAESLFPVREREFSLPAWLNFKNLTIFTVIFSVAACSCLLSLNMASYMRSVSFAHTASIDVSFIDTAMRKFALPASPDDFDEAGNISTMSSSKVSTAMPVTFRTYTVQKNDNITNITRAAGLSNISTLIAVNNISNVRALRAGQKLQIPSVDGLYHTVKRNESLAGIASSYGVTVENLLDVNDLSSTVIQSGAKLFIPNARLDSLELKKALGELFVSPLRVSWRLTSAFGSRKDPFTGVQSNHTGMDMAAPMGSPIRPAMDGKVSYAGFNRVYGNFVMISHAGGFQTLYGHMSAIHVKVNQKVTQETVIGLVGSTGYSTGPHLHFTVYHNGNMVNPAQYLK